MKTKLSIGCAILLLGFFALVFFGVKSLKPQPQISRSETVDRGDVEIKVVENGDIEPLRKVEVKSKVGGRVLKLLVEEGAVVKTGQVLATIDPQEVNSQVAALRAQLAGAKAKLSAAYKSTTYQKSQTGTNINQYRENVNAARARLRSAEAEARVQPEMTQQSKEIAKANLEAAKSALEAQEQTLHLMIDSTHPQAVVNAQAEYDRTKAQNANALRNVNRQKQLLEKGFVSQQAVDTAETEQLVAAAALREAKQRLDNMPQTNKLEESNARAQVANARSQVRQMEAALAQANATVLPDTKLQDLANARAALAQAQAQLEAARSGKTQDSMRGDEADASAADVQQIQNQLNESLVHQNDTTIVASMDGVITKRYVEAGEIITSAVSSFSSGSPIYQISDLKQMLVKININEVDIDKVKVGMPVDVSSDSIRGIVLPGHVRKVPPSANVADAAKTSSQSVVRFGLEVVVDKVDLRLKPGMSARCAVIVSRQKNVLRLPSSCVSGTGGDGTVQIVTSETKNGKVVETATARKVKTGLRGDGFIEIVSGVKVGEKVRPEAYDGPPRKTIDIGPN